MKAWKAIAAVAQNGVIGNGLEIPWRIPEDFKHFKNTTMGGIIVMGRNTWDSLGHRALPGRENVVISSRAPVGENVKFFKSLEDFSAAYKDDDRQVWICGGAALYNSALKFCSEIVLSRVKRACEGNIKFPDIGSDFTEGKIISVHADFDVVLYTRKKG